MIAELQRAGFERGDEVVVGELEFELDPPCATAAAAPVDPTLRVMTVVAKLGSSIVAGDEGALRGDVLDGVCAQVAELHGGARTW